MHKEMILITGANGEIGRGLITHLCRRCSVPIVTLDLKPLDSVLRANCYRVIQGDILDSSLIDSLDSEYRFSTIYHLASILSTQAEHNPETAHRVNVEGTLNILRLAVKQSQHRGRPVKFLYASSIAVYGLPDLMKKTEIGKLQEDQWCFPTTMYGCNKISCELLGMYYAKHYRQLAVWDNAPPIDFRCLRFPGLISADTVPTGGTSDYGPEMLHYAIQGKPYECFVRSDTRLPFMAMPDAIKAFLHIEAAPREKLTRFVYNVSSFSLTAEKIYTVVKEAFPKTEVSFKPHLGRQAIVDSWPADIDDTAAQQDWAWEPDYDQERAFSEYLIPAIAKRYGIIV